MVDEKYLRELPEYGLSQEFKAGIRATAEMMIAEESVEVPGRVIEKVERLCAEGVLDERAAAFLRFWSNRPIAPELRTSGLFHIMSKIALCPGEGDDLVEWWLDQVDGAPSRRVMNGMRFWRDGNGDLYESVSVLRAVEATLVWDAVLRIPSVVDVANALSRWREESVTAEGWTKLRIDGSKGDEALPRLSYIVWLVNGMRSAAMDYMPFGPRELKYYAVWVESAVRELRDAGVSDYVADTGVVGDVAEMKRLLDLSDSLDWDLHSCGGCGVPGHAVWFYSDRRKNIQFAAVTSSFENRFCGACSWTGGNAWRRRLTRELDTKFFVGDVPDDAMRLAEYVDREGYSDNRIDYSLTRGLALAWRMSHPNVDAALRGADESFGEYERCPRAAECPLVCGGFQRLDVDMPPIIALGDYEQCGYYEYLEGLADEADAPDEGFADEVLARLLDDKPQGVSAVYMPREASNPVRQGALL